MPNYWLLTALFRGIAKFPEAGGDYFGIESNNIIDYASSYYFLAEGGKIVDMAMLDSIILFTNSFYYNIFYMNSFALIFFLESSCFGYVGNFMSSCPRFFKKIP